MRALDRPIVGPRKTQETMNQDTSDGSSDVQPPALAVPAADQLLPDDVTEEELMNSGHELHDSYTCPLCCLPIALPATKHSAMIPCCMKRVCRGCVVASKKRGMGGTCPFCRTPTPKRTAVTALIQKRVDAKDPAATECLASAYYDGDHGLQQDIPRAIELWTEAARLGDLDAHNNLGTIYFYGNVVDQDVAKAIRHFQHAAIQGHPSSRYMLGVYEGRSENHETAFQHLIISAKMGDSDSLKAIKNMFLNGLATKVQYAEALRGYQNASEGTKSSQREEAKTFFRQK